MELNNGTINEPLIYFPNKKFKIKKITNTNNSILLYYSNIKGISDFNIILKSIKTREEYECSYDINEEYIEVYLDTLIDFFTDYEASIFLVVKKNNIQYYYTTVLKSSNIQETTVKTYSCNNYKWFIRRLPNEEIRLSCYKLIRGK